MLYLALTTELRRERLTALLWNDLDVESRTLTVPKSEGLLKGEVRVTQPQTVHLVQTICPPIETADLVEYASSWYSFSLHIVNGFITPYSVYLLYQK